MKGLQYYKSQYSNRKTLKGKASVMNKAMLNLDHADQQKFIKWQTDKSKSE